MSNKKDIQIGDWVVYKNGDMEYDNYYFIDNSRLNEENWLLHLSEKGWINFEHFIPAYLKACKNANIQYVKIKTFY
tara:strand:+ start:832 stop:1059 length:228 start_codon:yes stop_codon:yes gene_type:complete